MMILEPGNKLLAAHRRLFENDEPRFFVGEVVAFDAGFAKVKGYSFVRDVMGGTFIRKDDLRTKLLSIASGAFLMYQLPDDVDIDCVGFESHDAELILTDGKTLKMNMAEQPHRGQI